MGAEGIWRISGDVLKWKDLALHLLLFLFLTDWNVSGTLAAGAAILNTTKLHVEDGKAVREKELGTIMIV